MRKLYSSALGEIALSSTMFALETINQGITTAAVLWDSQNHEYTMDWRSGFYSKFQNHNGKITADIELLRNINIDLHQITEEVLKEGPEAVIFILTGFHTASLAQEIRKSNTETVFFSTEWAAGSADLIQLGGTAIEGMILLHPVKDSDLSPLFAQFMDHYISKFSPPVLYASIGTYDAVRMLCKAFEAQKPGQSLKESLTQLKEFNGILQTLRIDKNGDIPVALEFHTIQNGRFVPLNHGSLNQ